MNKIRALGANKLVRLLSLTLIIAFGAFGITYLAVGGGQSGAIVQTKCDERLACVYLENDHATPDVATVPVGGYVQFNSADGKTHSLGLGMGDAHHNGSHKHEGTYVSGDFAGDEAWRVQFKEAGTYNFHDHYRPDIHATVIVYKPGDSYTIN